LICTIEKRDKERMWKTKLLRTCGLASVFSGDEEKFCRNPK
jgi:hypothetical protein